MKTFRDYINLIESTQQDISEGDLELEKQFDIIESMIESWAEQYNVDSDVIWEDLESVDDEKLLREAQAWQTSKGKNKNGGLNKKGVASYRKSHPGSHLQTAVTTKPSKLKKGSKAAKRRKSFCARMKGMKKHRTGSKTAHDPNSRINKSLRKWNCESVEQLYDILQTLKEAVNPAQQAAIAIAKKEKQADENFANGKNPGRKGLSKRLHINTKGQSAAEIERRAKKATGEKKTMLHFAANMKKGHAKKNEN
jgi:excinuclease UvrABC ATPase subunit